MKSLFTTVVLLVIFCGQSQGLINKGKSLHLSHMDRWSIINYHNGLRRDVHAANMQELSWDRLAARAARAWSRQCNFDRRRRDMYGDNLFYSNSSIKEPANELLMDAMQKWAQEKDQYVPRQECGKTRRCEYLKIITAAVESVGCVVTRCPILKLGNSKSKTNVNFVVCFYTPYVDISRTSPYRYGEPCTHCRQGFSCKHKLCSPPVLPFRNLTFGAEYDVRLQGSKADVGKVNTVIDTPPLIKAVDVSVYDNKAYDGFIEQKKEGISELRGQGEDKYTQERKTNQRQQVSRRRDRFQEQIARPSGRTKRQARHDPYAERRRQYERRRHLERQQTERARRLQQQQDRQRILEEQRQRRRRPPPLLTYPRRRPNPQPSDPRRRPNPRPSNPRRRPNPQPTYPRRRPTPRPNYPRPITQSGELTTMEQNFFLQIHNTVRRDGLPKLEHSRNLERWAKYVIRCDTEYPGPINSFTNFGQATFNEPVYNAVYDWNAEGDDTFRKLKNGCRTPYDRSRCNHNTIIMNPSIREMACASKNCGNNRKIVCIYK